MGIRKMKAVELILDWNLWPRCKAESLDSTNITRMRESMKAGLELPPIIVDAKSLRVVDGFHRITACLREFGDDAEIKVDLREYKDDAEMFLDAGRTNAHHGLPMSPQDRAHFILRARKYKIPPAAIAEAIGMDGERIKDFLAKRTAKTETGETIALPGGALHFAGTTMTADQEHHARTCNGTIPMMHARMLLNAIRADGNITISDSSRVLLEELRDEIDKILVAA